jgi:glycosyltransferase involved in cell wall biosynthesis
VNGPRRIAIDASNFVRDRRGMGRLARPVLRAACDDDRFEVTLLADKPSDLRALRAEFAGTRLRSTRSARRKGRYDVAWFPFNGMRYSVAAPAIVAINDAFAFTEPHRELIARSREQSPIRRAAREGSRFVTISKWSRAEVARELGIPFDRIDVIVPAPDPFWHPGPADELPGALERSRFALVVGVGEARKNVRLAIDACARSFDRPDELLAIVGRLSDDDRAFARSLGVRAGEISASDAMLRALYRRASVVLVPSFAEGFGLVAVEALACGAPVLAADATALPEATAGAATLLDPTDTAAWARAIRTLFDDEAAASAARARAIARFASFDRSAPVRRMLALLDEVAARGA